MHVTYDVLSSHYDGGVTTITEGCESPHEALGAAIEYATRMKIKTLDLEPTIREWLEDPLQSCSLADAGIKRVFAEGSREAGQTHTAVIIVPRYGGSGKGNDPYHTVERAV